MTKKQKLLRIALALLVIAAIAGGTGFGIYKYRQMQAEVTTLRQKTATPVSTAENEKTVAAVRDLIELPSDETPTIATVSDAAKVKDQPFFSAAQNGDRVLVFAKLKKAILYRPSTNKIVDMAPVNINSASASGQVAGATTSASPSSTLKPTVSLSPSPSPTSKPQSLRLYLLNGTTTAGLASKYEPTVKAQLPDATISKESAAKTDYTKSEIVALTDTGKSLLPKISTALSLTPTDQLPAGQTAPAKTDIVIIIGQDKL